MLLLSLSLSFSFFLSLFKRDGFVAATTIWLGLFKPFDSVLTNLLVFSIWVGIWSSWLVISWWFCKCKTKEFFCLFFEFELLFSWYVFFSWRGFLCLLVVCVGSWCWNFEAFFFLGVLGCFLDFLVVVFESGFVGFSSSFFFLSLVPSCPDPLWQIIHVLVVCYVVFGVKHGRDCEQS